MLVLSDVGLAIPLLIVFQIIAMLLWNSPESVFWLYVGKGKGSSSSFTAADHDLRHDGSHPEKVPGILHMKLYARASPKRHMSIPFILSSCGYILVKGSSPSPDPVTCTAN
jgi:hypothetical protein